MKGKGKQRRPTNGLRADRVTACRDASTVRIFKPSRSVMQAGRANSQHWVLEFEPRFAPFIEPLMGWTGSRDTLRQVRLKFPTKESAVAFAERQGLPYTVHAPPEERLQLKSYADNFRPRRRRMEGAGKQFRLRPHLAANTHTSSPNSQQQERR